MLKWGKVLPSGDILMNIAHSSALWVRTRRAALFEIFWLIQITRRPSLLVQRLTLLVFKVSFRFKDTLGEIIAFVGCNSNSLSGKKSRSEDAWNILRNILLLDLIERSFSVDIPYKLNNSCWSDFRKMRDCGFLGRRFAWEEGIYPLS